MDTKTETLVERVDRLVQPRNSPRMWGNPRLSSTPASLAIRELSVQNEALQDAVRGSQKKSRGSRNDSPEHRTRSA